MTQSRPQLQVTARVVYQRPTPPPSAPVGVRAIYQYGCHMLRELFGGRRVKRSTTDAAFAVMNAYKSEGGTGNLSRDRAAERRVASDTLLVVDAMELERGAPIDENGNERWGAAIDRLATFEKEARKEFKNPSAGEHAS